MSINKQQSKQLLISSLVLIAIGLTGSFYFNSFSEYSARYEIFESLSLLYVLLLAVVVAPITEEFIFRSLVVSNENKKSLVLGLLLLGAIVFYKINIVAIILFCMLTILSFSKLSFVNKKIGFIIGTSILFSIYHIEGVLSLATIFMFIYYLGMGGVLSFIANKKGLSYSIICHAMFNLLVTSSLVLLFFKYLNAPEMVLETEVLDGNIEFTTSKSVIGSYSFITADSIKVYNTQIQDLTFNLLNSDKILKVRKGNIYKKINASFFRKKGNTLKEDVLKELLTKKIVKIDTVLFNGKCLKFNLDNYKAKQRDEKDKRSQNFISKYHNFSLGELMEFVYKKHNKHSFLQNATTKTIGFKEQFAIKRGLSLNELKLFLEEEYGIITNSEIKSITYLKIQ